MQSPLMCVKEGAELAPGDAAAVHSVLMLPLVVPLLGKGQLCPGHFGPLH